LYIASENRSDFDQPAQKLPADISNAIGLTADGVGVPLEVDLGPLQTGQSETKSKDGDDQPPTLVLTPDLGVQQDGQGTEGPVLSPEVIEPGGDLIETPEPATYASIGVGLIGLWCLSRRKPAA
jgi:hypothetical protein